MAGNGREEWVLIHLEVQIQEESEFPRRMFVYNYREFDRYNKTVVSLAVWAMTGKPGGQTVFPTTCGAAKSAFARHWNRNLRQELTDLEKEKQMPYITSFERMAKEEGMPQGRRNT